MEVLPDISIVLSSVVFRTQDLRSDLVAHQNKLTSWCGDVYCVW